MSYPNPSTALATVILDELERGGVGLAAAGPGSRSTALVLAAQRSDMDLVMAVDERSAAFHALGWAKASGRPAAVLTTSGTAAANLLPAAVEADRAGVPLILLTSDRPPEVRRAGANQTIEQPGMFGGFVRTAFDLGPAEVHATAPRWWRSAISQVLSEALGFGGRPGPVHVNVAFREPTVPVSDDGRTRAEPYPHTLDGRAGRQPWTEGAGVRHPHPAIIARLGEELASVEKGLMVAGAGAPPAVVALAQHLGWPLVATAESGLRRLPGALGTGHHLVGRARPDLLVRFGPPGPSRRVIDLVASDLPQVVVGDQWSDPGRSSFLIVGADPSAVAEQVIEVTEATTPGEWQSWWIEADRTVTEAVMPHLEGEATEPAVAATVARMDTDQIVVASSMPIRDVEAFGFAAPRVVANRGASGIDGFVSTSLGAGRLADRPLALTGDLSLLHDSNGFLCDPRPPCVFVVIDNRGGGIFSFLPQAEHAAEHFERLFATPHGRDLARFADYQGLAHTPVTSTAELKEAIEVGWRRQGTELVVVETDRSDNVSEHQRLDRLVADALDRIPPP